MLDVNYRSIYEPSLYAAEDVIYTLFELDEHYPINLHDIEDSTASLSPEKHVAVDFNSHLPDDFFVEWQQRKKDLADGVISMAEYMEWKLNWPQTCNDGNLREPAKKWRKS